MGQLVPLPVGAHAIPLITAPELEQQHRWNAVGGLYKPTNSDDP
jgi:hypothetical protein